MDAVSVAPWKVDENGERESRAVAIKMDDCEGSEERSTEVKPTVPRKFYIKGSVLQEHGYSAGCLGCVSMLRIRIGRCIRTRVGDGWRSC